MCAAEYIYCLLLFQSLEHQKTQIESGVQDVFEPREQTRISNSPDQGGSRSEPAVVRDSGRSLAAFVGHDLTA
jgi:hypothetical protein